MNESDILPLAEQLIAIESTANRPEKLHEALQFVENLLAKTPGVCIEHFEQNGKPSLLAYCAPKRPEQFRVLLNGHVDVVAATPEQFKPRTENGKLYGRGALDMKTAALVLAQVFCELAPKVDFPLGLQIVTDEEIGGSDGTGYQLQQGVKADFVIAGEFTPDAAICTESRGICWAEVTFRGKAAHSAYLWNGENAVLAANAFTTELLEHYPVPKSDAWVTTVNVAALNTENTTFNRVPDIATVKLDMRYVAEDENFKDRAATATFLQQLAPDAEVNILSHEPSHHADQANPLLQKLAQAVEAEYQQPANFIRKHGASDVRFFSAQGNQAVVLGLQGEGLHSDDEFVHIGSVARYQCILKEFLQSLER